MQFVRGIILYSNFLLDFLFIIAYFFFSVIRFAVKLFLPSSKKSLKNEIVLVTGGNNGIGKEILLRLGQTDPEVTLICWGRDENRNQEVVKDLRAIGVSKVYAFNVDVTDVNQVSAAAEQIRKEIGDVTMLFNNAGISGRLLPMWDLSAADARKLFEVNLFSHFTTIREFVPAMIRNGRGHIVANCSILGFLWGPKGTSYVSCKHAMTASMECLKEDLRVAGAGEKVKVTVIYPSVTYTNMEEALQIQPKKYPFILHALKATYVAKRAVEGVLANEAHVYMPSWFRFAHMIVSLIPAEVVSKVLGIIKVDPGLPSPPATA